MSYNSLEKMIKSEHSKELGSLTYKKRAGTTNLGELYEELFSAYVILQLLQNNDVKDFRISTNDKKFGDFDAFVLEVEHTNQSIEMFAIQMKHKDNRNLKIENLKLGKDFNIMKYYKSFQECIDQLSDFKLILYTNAKFTPDNNTTIDVGNDESVKVKITECDPFSLISNLESGKSFQLQLHSYNSEEIKEKYKDFFGRFFLYTNQMNVQELEETYIPHSLRTLTSRSSVQYKLLKCISQWSRSDGIKNKLTKNIMVKVITLYIVEELIQPHTFCEVDEKKKLFQTVMSYFNITTFNNKSLENVVKIWGDAKNKLRGRNINEINRIIRIFQICTKHINDIDDLKDEELTKLLWVMDECPLIIKDHPVAYEAAKLCGEKSKFVFITDELNVEKLEELTIFKTLSDLKSYESTYNNIMKNLSFTLFGEETNLENLFKNNDTFNNNLLTTNEIAKIVDNVDLIKLEEEALCFPYVARHLYKNIMDPKYLQKLDENSMILISNVGDEGQMKHAFPHFEIVSITEELHKSTDDTTYTNDKEMFEAHQYRRSEKYKLFFNKTETSPKEFTSLCYKNKKYRKFHHFKYHDGYLEWIESIGDVLDVQNFSIQNENFIEDEKLCAQKISKNLNIVVGDPGMGKSIFLKNLKNNLLSKYFTVIIRPIDVPELYRFVKDPKNLQTFFTFVVESKFMNYKNFEKQILKLLMEKGKSIFLWDSLDKLTEENLFFVEKLIAALSKKSLSQFLTSRGFLRKRLEDRFNVLSQVLQPFNDKQQTDYIHRRLQDICSREELESITIAIKENIANTTYREILAIPLQLYMLTQLFRQDLEKRKKLFIELFVITDMFFHFIDQKFYFHCVMEINYPAKNIDEETLSRRIKNYQLAAIKSIFGTAFYIESNKESNLFLTKIKEKGDKYGLITAVDLNMQPKFLHHSYAEYFAANYLAENCRRIPNLELIFDRKHVNVKYFFDSLLAKNSPAHIAVLCKNLKFLQDWRNTDAMKSKDLQGRNALHLAASWGEKYPILEMSEIRDDPNDSITATFFQELRELNHSNIGTMIIINDNNNNKVKTENNEHYRILDTLAKVCDPNEVDELFRFTPTMYAEKCECLLTAAYIAKRGENRNYLSNKNEKFVYSLLYYGIKHGFNNIADLFGNLKFILTNNGNSILHMAAANNQIEYVKKLLSQKVYIQNIGYRNRLGKTALGTAVENRHQNIVEYIKQHNAKIDASENDVTSVMTATTEGHVDKMGHQQQQNSVYSANNLLILAAQKRHLETIKYLTQGGTNVNATLTNGRTLLLEAACSGNLEVVKYSIQNRAQIDAKDNNGFTSLMLAAKKGHYATVKYLVKKGANINTKSTNGSTPLLEAASYGHLEIVRYLVQHNAKIDAANNEGFAPLMVAALNGHLETVKYLTQNDADVNTTSRNLMRPLMVAARQGHLETVKYLTQKSADINTTSASGRTSLMEAASHGHIQIVKYLIQQKAEIDKVDNDGFTPLMAAAQKGHIETVKYLAQQGADINWSSHNGRTALIEAAFRGHLEVVIYLKRNNAKSDGNSTSLMAAAQAGHLEIVRYLAQDPEFHAPSSNITTLK